MSSLDQVRQRYRTYLGDALLAAHVRLELPDDVTLDVISPRALKAFETDWGHELRLVDWDWRAQVENRRREPTCFEIALWSGDCLCGLALGSLSNNRRIMRLHGLEENPSIHPLQRRVAEIVLEAAAIYGKQGEATKISLERPSRADRLIEHYRKLGFSPRETDGEWWDKEIGAGNAST